MGASIEAGDDNGVELLRAILTHVIPPRVTCKDVRPRLIEGERRGLLTVFNDSAEDQTATIALPRKYTRVKDIYDQRELRVDQHDIHVVVPYESVLVLLLE